MPDLPQRPLPIAVQRLDSVVERIETPCGSGHVVWRRWSGGAPVLLLHGGSGSWTHWVRNIPALLQAGHAVFAPDLPGFGDSASPPGGGDADAMIEPLLAGLDQVLPQSFALVGFSFGSLVATLLAARLGMRVQQLVLVGAPVLPLASGRGVTLQPWRHLPTQRERDEVHAANLLAMMLHRRDSVTQEAVALHAINVPRDRMRSRRLVTTDLLTRTLASLACPCRMIYGAEDVLYRGCWPEVMACTARLAAVREVERIPDAGHWVQFEQAAAFDATLGRMLLPVPGAAR